MVWPAVLAVASYGYNEVKDAEEEAAELDALVAPLFDPANETEAATLPVIAKFWKQIDNEWYYLAHNDIKLWMLANTYLPKSDWPAWVDAKGTLRTSFSVAANTWMLWREADPESVYTLRDQAQQVAPYLVGKTDSISVWPMSEGGGVRTVSFPKEAFVALPDGFPVKMPPAAVAQARKLGAIPTAIGKGKLKPFSLPQEPQSPSTSRALLAIGFAVSTLAVASYFLWKRG